MTPEDFINKVICGDCLEVMKLMPDKCVDLVLTDPPYGTGGRSGSVHLNQDDSFGNRMSLDSYNWFMRHIAGLLYAKTKDNSHCYFFCDWRSFLNSKVAFESVGWEARSLIIWDKENGMGEFWRSSFEMILFLTKEKPKKLSGGGYFNVIRLKPVKGKKRHSAEKPIELIKILIEASSKESDTILDPFLGSGTTAVAAKQLGRNFIGIEISEKYCRIANERLRQEILL